MLDTLLRWDLLVLLERCTNNLQLPDLTLLVVGSKLLKKITQSVFDSNLYSTTPRNGFVSNSGVILNESKKIELNSLLQYYNKSTPLCVSFLYGGVPQAEANNYIRINQDGYILILDNMNVGFKAVFPQTTIDLLKQFTNY